MGADLDGYCATPSDNVDMPIDFFLPGSPEERWSVAFTIGGTPYYASFSELNGDDSSDDVTATHSVSDLTSGDNLSGKVVSVISLNSVEVLRVTVTHAFEKTDAFFTSKVYIENLYGSALSDVRYMRSFDPDNARFQGGDFYTKLTILKTFQVDGANVVQAKLMDEDITNLSATNEILERLSTVSGITTEIPIVYYTREPDSVVYYGGFANPNPYDPAEEGDYFANPQAKGSTDEDDIAIGVIFKAGSLSSGARTKNYTYVTSLDARDFDELETELAAIAEVEPDVSTPTVVSNRLPQIAEFEPGPVLAVPGQKLRLTGYRLYCTSFVKVNGQNVDYSFSPLSDGKSELVISIPLGLSPGFMQIEMDSCGGSVTYGNMVYVAKSPAVFEVATKDALDRGLAIAQLKTFVQSRAYDYNFVECVVNAGPASLQTVAREMLDKVCSSATSLLSTTKGFRSEFRTSHKSRNIWIKVVLSSR
jgi:hypothetical protein